MYYTNNLNLDLSDKNKTGKFECGLHKFSELESLVPQQCDQIRHMTKSVYFFNLHFIFVSS
jgi:hypothetical protein